MTDIFTAWRNLAKVHREADLGCGRSWQCACAACRYVRDRDLAPRASLCNPSQNSAKARFVAIHESVMRGQERIATAKSKTMAKRIANALNKHTVNSEGV